MEHGGFSRKGMLIFLLKTSHLPKQSVRFPGPLQDVLVTRAAVSRSDYSQVMFLNANRWLLYNVMHRVQVDDNWDKYHINFKKFKFNESGIVILSRESVEGTKGKLTANMKPLSTKSARWLPYASGRCCFSLLCTILINLTGTRSS